MALFVIKLLRYTYVGTGMIYYFFKLAFSTVLQQFVHIDNTIQMFDTLITQLIHLVNIFS